MFTKERIHDLGMGGLNKFIKDIVEYIKRVFCSGNGELYISLKIM